MPKTTRNHEEILAVKEKILDAALDILFESGFQVLSMRKIATRVKMTAANLYNYFSSKDEIYLAIQTRGFDLLYQRFEEIDRVSADPLEKIRRMIRAYIDFGIHCPDHYEIMFTRNTPKYSDYVGTHLEPPATIEKKAALKVAETATKALLELQAKNSRSDVRDTDFLIIQLWTTLHGLVSLLNSRVLQEVESNTAAVIDKLSEKLLMMISGQRAG
ncbi:TetR/AcrR family transcriptional regulator [Desulfatiferula olefinivorans]